MKDDVGLTQLLETAFDKRHVEAALDYFVRAVEAFQQQDWEKTITRVGKLIEAILKALYVSTGQAVPRGRLFKVDKVLQGLEQTPQGAHHDSIRLTIPRACRFGYDIASNRGARHDPDEVDPNMMDATILIGVGAWILAEMVRVAQRGKMNADRAARLVDRLMAPRYPVIENVEGRIYFHGAQKSARAVALVILLAAYPGRVSREELVTAIARNGFTENAAQVAVTRLRGAVDADSAGNLILLAPGRREAEELLSSNGAE